MKTLLLHPKARTWTCRTEVCRQVLQWMWGSVCLCMHAAVYVLDIIVKGIRPVKLPGRCFTTLVLLHSTSPPQKTTPPRSLMHRHKAFSLPPQAAFRSFLCDCILLPRLSLLYIFCPPVVAVSEVILVVLLHYNCLHWREPWPEAHVFRLSIHPFFWIRYLGEHLRGFLQIWHKHWP